MNLFLFRHYFVRMGNKVAKMNKIKDVEKVFIRFNLKTKDVVDLAIINCIRHCVIIIDKNGRETIEKFKDPADCLKIANHFHDKEIYIKFKKGGKTYNDLESLDINISQKFSGSEFYYVVNPPLEQVVVI